MRSDHENCFYLIEMCWWTHEKLLWRVVNLEMEFSFFFLSEEKYFKFTDLSVKIWSFPADAAVKNPPANAGDTRDEGSNPGSGR